MSKILLFVSSTLVMLSFWQYYKISNCLNKQTALLYNLEICKFEKEDNSRMKTAIEQIKAIQDVNTSDEDWI